MERRVSNLPEIIRPAARLSLLAALSPYQVDGQIIDSFSKFNPEDAALLAALSWASFVTVIRISKWLSKPFYAQLKWKPSFFH